MHKGKIQRQFKIFKIYKDLYRKPLKQDWVARVIFGRRCHLYSWDMWRKIYRLPSINMLFKFLITKFCKKELFSCLWKVDDMINYCKRPIDQNGHENSALLKFSCPLVILNLTGFPK